jgi:hypothetical protein
MQTEVPTTSAIPHVRTSRARLGALAALALLLPCATVGGATTATAAPKKSGPVAVTKVTGVPTTTTPGAGLRVVTSVRNAGATTAGTKTLDLHLSKNRRLDSKDTRLARARTGKIRAKTTTKVTARVKLPARLAPGTYYVLSCLGSKCKVARTSIPGGGPSVADRGTLTGNLTFTRTTPFEPGTTLDMSAQVAVAMSYVGPVTRPDELTSTGSTYSYVRTTREEVSTQNCTTVTEDRGGGSGTLAETANKYDDEIFGNMALLDLSEISLTTIMRYSHGEVVTRTGDDSCSPGQTVGPVFAARHATSLTLSQVSRTATDITYRVSSWRDSDSTRSDWEQVGGTLTLHLG